MWVIFKVKVINILVFDYEISVKDIFNVFGGN